MGLREFILRCVGIGVGILGHAAAGMLRVGVREAATVPYGWKLVLGVMLRVRLRRRKGHAVDGRVGVADGAQRVRHVDAASVVDGLAEQKNRAPIFGRLLPKVTPATLRTTPPTTDSRGVARWRYLSSCSAPEPPVSMAMTSAS